MAVEMEKDQGIGALILVASIIGIIVYGLLIWWFPMIVTAITAFIAVAIGLGIIAWIGWTMATTPPPPPIEAPVPETTPSSPAQPATEQK